MSSYDVLAYPGHKLPDEYLSLIHSAWKRSLRSGNDYFKLAESNSYFKTYTRYIDRILAHPDAVVRIAVLPDDVDVVLGFSVCRGSVLDYVYVQTNSRRIGVAKSLVPATIDTISHLTRTALTIWGGKYFHWVFDPFA